MSSRLKKLVENGIMKKNKDPIDSRRMKYRLTEKGRDLYPVTLAFMQWGDRWLADEKGPPLLLFHKQCGHQLIPVICCEYCGKVVDAKEVTYEEIWKSFNKERRHDESTR